MSSISLVIPQHPDWESVTIRLPDGQLVKIYRSELERQRAERAPSKRSE